MASKPKTPTQGPVIKRVCWLNCHEEYGDDGHCFVAALELDLQTATRMVDAVEAARVCADVLTERGFPLKFIETSFAPFKVYDMSGAEGVVYDTLHDSNYEWLNLEIPPALLTQVEPFGEDDIEGFREPCAYINPHTGWWHWEQAGYNTAFDISGLSVSDLAEWFPELAPRVHAMFPPGAEPEGDDEAEEAEDDE